MMYDVKTRDPVSIPKTKMLCNQILSYILSEENFEMKHLGKKDCAYLHKTYELLARRINLIEKRNKGCV